MANVHQSLTNSPSFLKVLLGIVALFVGSLVLLILTLIFQMLGFVFQIPALMNIVPLIEQIGIYLMLISIIAGGMVSSFGLITRLARMPNPEVGQTEQLKNESSYYDIRDHGLSVEDVLSDMSMHERELLTQKLAESRLAIREDGTLIPIEQAEKLNKIERFIDGE